MTALRILELYILKKYSMLNSNCVLYKSLHWVRLHYYFGGYVGLDEVKFYESLRLAHI